MTDEVFTWDASSNNRMMLAGQGSLALNAISITRTGENEKIAVADNIWLAKSAKGSGTAHGARTRHGRLRHLEVCRKYRRC